jgi:hypothetical protein
MSKRYGFVSPSKVWITIRIQIINFIPYRVPFGFENFFCAILFFYYSMMSRWDVFLVNDFFKNSHTSSFTVTNSSSVMPNPSARFGCGSTGSSTMTNSSSTYTAENSHVMPTPSARFGCGSTGQTAYDLAAVVGSSYPHQSPVIQEIERRREQQSVNTAASQAGSVNMPRIVLASGRSIEEDTPAASWSGCEGQLPLASLSGCEGQPSLASRSGCEGQTPPASGSGCEGQPPLASSSGCEDHTSAASGSGCEGQPPLDSRNRCEGQTSPALSPMPLDPGSGSEEQTLPAYNEDREDQRPPASGCVNAAETVRNLRREGATTVEGPSVLPSVGDSRLPLVSAGEFTSPVVSAGDFTFSTHGNFSDRHASDRPPNSAYSTENCASFAHFRKEQPLIFLKEYPVLNNLYSFLNVGCFRLRGIYIFLRV